MSPQKDIIVHKQQVCYIFIAKHLTCCFFKWQIGSCQTTQPSYSRSNI